jgi:hypothetical protein
MINYYLNRRPMLNGLHAIHTENCPFVAGEDRRIYLGEYESCKDAVRAARKHFSGSEGCLFCSQLCAHTIPGLSLELGNARV